MAVLTQDEMDALTRDAIQKHQLREKGMVVVTHDGGGWAAYSTKDAANQMRYEARLLQETQKELLNLQLKLDDAHQVVCELQENNRHLRFVAWLFGTVGVGLVVFSLMQHIHR